MEQIKLVMKHMIDVSDVELHEFLSGARRKTIYKQQFISVQGAIPNDVFFINKGIVRVMITDKEGKDHTIHFALENQFIADYANFIRKEPSLYTLQALEDTEVVVLPRKIIEWGYTHLQEGQKMGRLVAEYYFIYQDDRIRNLYARTPKERYDHISEIFPNIHNRVPQHMIASYLGITPVHLSRLKKGVYQKS
jgi:CRP-like cAMP-binding protein